MNKVTISGYTFYYKDNMVHFYDERKQQILFVSIIGTDENGINAYDGANIVVDISKKNIEFQPLWNTNVEVKDANTYILKHKF
ncbi:hypothetical protein [Apilactobacillus quenuiae]|uniref:hypothetical protein n=1 Tax=Apilactobacillus quenuiae TaxID=2008377 RepID=UPI000D01BF5A|nr:hypothetical protein [Apilactobacillus quenuiae]